MEVGTSRQAQAYALCMEHSLIFHNALSGGGCTLSPSGRRGNWGGTEGEGLAQGHTATQGKSQGLHPQGGAPECT